MDDLNIRAAKALGWEQIKSCSGTNCIAHPDGCLYPLDPDDDDNHMAFTTSHDWAMLLAKKVKDMGYQFTLEMYNEVDAFDDRMDVYRVRIWDLVEHDSMLSDECNSFENVPKLITEVCLDFFKSQENE